MENVSELPPDASSAALTLNSYHWRGAEAERELGERHQQPSPRATRLRAGAA